MSNADEYELNFLKIDSNNNAKLIGVEDIELEILDLIACVSPFEAESMDGILLKFFKKFIPTVQDLLKTNIELSRQFLKHSDKKGLNIVESINRILSTDFKEKFIFNKINIQDVCNILAISFNDIRKFKISNFSEFQAVLKKLNFKKYKLDKLYLNTEYIKNKYNSHNSRLSSLRTVSSITSNSASVKEVDEASEIDDMQKNMNKYHNKALGVIYIDNNINNIINSSSLNSDYDYNEEELNKRLLTKECFSYQKSNKDEGELPIELIILLYKLKNVKTLIYQINNIDEQFFKLANFIFLNIKWIFMNEIEEIIFDLGNETLQKGINDVFNERASEIYYNSQIIKNAIYYNGSYKARTINCWEPECDIFFDKNINNENKKDYIYSEQSNIENVYFDNHLCNIYNEYGNLTNLKYIRPLIYTIKNNDNQNEQKLEEIDDIDNFLNNENIHNRIERESIYLNNNSNSLNSKNVNLNSSLNQNLSNANMFVEKTTPALLKDFVKKHIFYFQMIPLYSYFFMKDFKKIKKLGLYFHKSYSFEIQIMLKLFDVSYDRFHFLNFISGIDTLTEADFSFNSLDNKSFENILGIINKNANLTSLKISFFTTDINYFINSLLNIWSSKKLSIRKIFLEQKEYLINNTGDKERDMNYFILNHNKFLECFSKNLRNFFNLLKVKSLNNLEELILRFDIPLQILNSEKYIIILVKFIINIFIMLTFQENRIHTLKILAPELPFNTAKMPYIRNLFKEILLERENIDERFEEKMKNEKKKKEIKKIKEKEREIKEQREKENELKEKNARKDYLENVSNIPSNFSTKDVVKTNEDKDDNLEIDIDDNIAQYDYSKRFKSVFQKKKSTTIIGNETPGNEAMGSDKLLIDQRRHLNSNVSLENIIIQFKIYNLPEIFNIMIMNNLMGLKSINLGYLDEITFVSFIKDFKLYAKQLHNLTSLKISLGPSVISFNNLEKNIYEFININSPKLEEKFLFSDLKIVSETKMKEFVDLVYFKASIPKIVIQIGNDNDNIHLLSKVIDKFTKNRLNEMYSLIMLMDLPQYKPLYTMNIIRCLASFYSKKENSAILCKENPNNCNY